MTPAYQAGFARYSGNYRVSARFYSLLLWSLLVFPLTDAKATSADNNEAVCQKINAISIVANDVFEDASPNLLEATANFLHFTTHEYTIRRELLFKEQECLDIALIEESARNLRALPIFSDVEITTAMTSGGDVDVVVTTKDRFTLRAEVSASQKSGSTKQRLSLGEKNLFGLNKEFHYSYTNQEDQSKSRYVYKDNRFFHDWVLYGAYTSARGGAQQNYAISDPFRSLGDDASYGIAFETNDQDFVYKIDAGEEIEVPQFSESEQLFYTREFGDRDVSKRLGGSFQMSQQSYFSDNLSDNIDIPTRLEKMDIDITGALQFRDDFVVLQGLDSLIYREDIALGSSWTLGLGAQWRQDEEGIRYHQKYRLGYARTKYNYKDVLSSALIEHEGRYYAGHLMESRYKAFYHCYYMPEPGYVWLGGVTYQYRYGRDILNEPLSMGGEVGFRGYKTGTFTGNKSLLLNLEYRDRISTNWEKIAVGQAFFADAGYAWKQGEDMRLNDLKFNVGWGLRFDIPSLFGKDILRFDLAVATNTGEVLSTLTLGQVFRYNEINENTQKEF